MAKTGGYTLGLVLSDFPGLDQSKHIIEAISIGGDKMELVEVNDLSSTTMWRDYIEGLKEKGEITVTVHGNPQLTLGAKGKVSITSESGAGQVTLAETPVIITELPDIDTDKSKPLTTQLKYKMLPDDSRLASAATGSTGN